MKVQGFNNSIPPANEGNNKNINTHETSIESPKKRNIPLKGGLKTEVISEKSSLSTGILNGNDKIEITFDPAAESGKQNKVQNAVYNLENVRGHNNDSTVIEKNNKLANIRQKIADGYYDSPEFIDKFADKLMTVFNISGE